MKYSMVLATAALLFLTIPTTAAAGDDAGIYRDILEQKAPSIVTVKLVLKVKIAFMGQSQDIEREVEVAGVIVDKSGLIMISGDAFDIGGALGQNDQIDMKVTPLSMDVIFEDDDEEYEAILGAKDTNLNIAFVLIKDLKGKELKPVLFSDGAKVAVGQELIGVTRYTKGFDYAAHFGTLRVTGQVYQPRPLWAIDGGFSGLGLPVFTKDGQVAGVLATQEGSEGTAEGGGGQLGMLLDMAGGISVFLLPVDTVNATILQAGKQAREALKKQEEEGDE
jgi:hypothetical protein